MNLVSEDMKWYIENTLSDFVRIVHKSRECFRFRCPLCGDSKKSKGKVRGNYYRRTGSYHCFNCGADNSGLFVVSELGDIDINEVRKDFLQTLVTPSEERYTLPKLVEKKVVETFEIPDNWVDIPRYELKKFVLDRKVLEAKGAPKNWRLYYNNLTDRIAIPWVRDNKIEYYQERSIREYQESKYLFPKDMKKSIFGLDNLDFTWPYILFTEGVFDSVFIKNAVAIGGIFPTIEQLKYLEQVNFGSELVWFPDNPWKDKSSFVKIIKQAKKYPNQKIYMWRKSVSVKDVNDLVLAIDDINFFFDNTDEIESRITTLNKASIMLQFDNDIL